MTHPITIHRTSHLPPGHACQHCGRAIIPGETVIIVSWWERERNEYAWFCQDCSEVALIRVGELMREGKRDV